MSTDTRLDSTGSGGDLADHVTEARQRARKMLATESHLGDVDDWRRTLVAARDALIYLWLTWLALHGFGDPPFTALMLVAMAIALALLIGISTARSTHTQVQYYTSELERERAEIRDNFEQERGEIRELYAAKGFRGDLLEQIIDTLCADDDRLLKVMMEEELGLSLHHVHHPIVVGLWNSAAAAVAGLLLALPLLYLSPDIAHVWMPCGGAVLLAIISVLAACATRRSFLEFFAASVVMAVVTGGVVYFLAQWFAGFSGGEAAL